MKPKQIIKKPHHLKKLHRNGKVFPKKKKILLKNMLMKLMKKERN